MRTYAFAKRCAKEILRDPLNILFGLGFPLVILLLLSAIQSNIPIEMFEIQSLTPGVTVFGLSFMTLFSATLIARDREEAFLQRLYTTPLKPVNFIVGYMLPIVPIAVVQSVICYAAAILFFGLKPSINILYAILMLIPISVFYISLGLLCGSLLNVKQVGGICGALLTNLSAWLSGVWFDIDLLGNAFKKIANILPFIHAVELEKNIIFSNYTEVPSHLLPILLYSIITTIISVKAFLHQMKNQ